MKEHDKPNRFSRARIKQILARATELESRADFTLTEAELYEIAAEAGIDLQALERSIAEIGPDAMLGPEPSASVDFKTWWTAIKALGVPGMFATGVGASTGVVRVMTGSHGFHPESLAGLFLIVAAAVGAGASSRGAHRHLLFQIKNLGLWCGFSLGFALTVPTLVDDIAGVGLMSAVVSALIGPFIVEYRHRKMLRGASQVRSAADPKHADENDSAGPVWRQRVSRVVNGLLGNHHSLPIMNDLSKQWYRFAGPS